MGMGRPLVSLEVILTPKAGNMEPAARHRAVVEFNVFCDLHRSTMVQRRWLRGCRSTSMFLALFMSAPVFRVQEIHATRCALQWSFFGGEVASSVMSTDSQLWVWTNV